MIAAIQEGDAPLDVWDTITSEQRRHLQRCLADRVSVYVSATGKKQLELVLNTESPDRVKEEHAEGSHGAQGDEGSERH